MPTISAHLPAATYKRLRSRLGRKRNASAFIRMAVEEKLADEHARQAAPGVQRIAASIEEILEDEMDIRIAEERIARVERGESKVYSREEALKMLGL